MLDWQSAAVCRVGASFSELQQGLPAEPQLKRQPSCCLGSTVTKAKHSLASSLQMWHCFVPESDAGIWTASYLFSLTGTSGIHVPGMEKGVFLVLCWLIQSGRQSSTRAPANY